MNCVEGRAVDLFMRNDDGWSLEAREVFLLNIRMDVVDGVELGGKRGFVCLEWVQALAEVRDSYLSWMSFIFVYV